MQIVIFENFETIVRFYSLLEINGFFDIVLGGMNRAQELEDAVDFCAGKPENITRRER